MREKRNLFEFKINLEQTLILLSKCIDTGAERRGSGRKPSNIFISPAETSHTETMLVVPVNLSIVSRGTCLLVLKLL